MKKDTELDNLLEEFQSLIDSKEDDFRTIKEDAMLLAMSDKYGRKPHDREAVIQSLKEEIRRKRLHLFEISFDKGVMRKCEK